MKAAERYAVLGLEMVSTIGDAVEGDYIDKAMADLSVEEIGGAPAFRMSEMGAIMDYSTYESTVDGLTAADAYLRDHAPSGEERTLLEAFKSSDVSIFSISGASRSRGTAVMSDMLGGWGPATVAYPRALADERIPRAACCRMLHLPGFDMTGNWILGFEPSVARRVARRYKKAAARGLVDADDRAARFAYVLRRYRRWGAK